MATTFFSNGILNDRHRNQHVEANSIDNNNSNEEEVPFLDYDGNDNEDFVNSSDQKPTAAQSQSPPPPPANPSSKLRTQLMIILFLVILSIELGAGMLSGPLTRILESIACRQYYVEVDASKLGEDGQVAESLCKTKEVQMELAAVRGYMEFFDGVLSMPSFLSFLSSASRMQWLNNLIGAALAIPYGLLADRYGRRPTIFLSIPGFAINALISVGVLWFSDIFPLRFIWLSCLAWFFGGGPAVTFAIMWTMMADTTDESER